MTGCAAFQDHRLYFWPAGLYNLIFSANVQNGGLINYSEP